MLDRRNFFHACNKKALEKALKRDFGEIESSLKRSEATIIAVGIPYARKLFSDDVVFLLLLLPLIPHPTSPIHNVLGLSEVLPHQ